MRDFANLRRGIARGGVGLNVAWRQRRGAEICFALALSPVITLVRPFGVDEQTFLARLGYWGGLLVCWFIITAIVEALLADRRFFRDLPSVTRRCLVIALAAMPMIIIAGAATHALSGWQASVAEVAELYGKIIIIGTFLTLLAKAMLPASGETAPVPVEPPLQPVATEAIPPASSPLLMRLPSQLRGRILCLEMEDHYVRVHTEIGSALVLLRLSDAIAEAHPSKGQQVHRSWWVSNEAVEHFERVGRVGVVRLSNGVQAPVSQRYLRTVETSFT